MITRQDFVEWQLLIAAGHKLPKKQDEIKIHGHAMEARIYSEDPYNGFLPGSGKILYLHEPRHRHSKINPDEDVRIETGVRQGDEVSVFYDPMISKLVCWAETRELCNKNMSKALEHYKILGLPNNIKFVHTIINHPMFKKWDIDTNFIAKYKDDLITNNLNEEVKALDVLSTVLSKIVHDQIEGGNGVEKNFGPWGVRDNFRVNYRTERTFKMNFNEGVKSDKKTIEVNVKYLKENLFNVNISGLLDGVDVNYSEVTVSHLGDFDILINIKEHSIFKAKYYITPEGNVRVLKNDGGVTNIVSFYFILFYFNLNFLKYFFIILILILL
jgi:3-methylcrotonyl-CoA carboxylase alpha subunit